MQEEPRLNLENVFIAPAQSFDQLAVLSPESHRMDYADFESQALACLDDSFAILEA
ncbi:hypothetical protein D3C84_934770 [compost metagenome]